MLFSAFFSGIEIAYISSNKFQIEIENKRGSLPSRIIGNLVKKPSRFIASMLVGNNIALVVYSYFMPDLLDPLLGGISSEYFLLLVQTVIATFFILIFAEFLPKAIFNTHSNNLLQFFALPSALFYYLFYPIVSFMIALSDFIMRTLLNTKPEEDQLAFDKVDLDNYVKERAESHSNEDEVDHEIQIFRNALQFGDQKAREFMVPRTEIIALDLTSGIAELREKFVESNLSKVLIYKDSIDNITGYVHSFELFKKPENLRAIIRPVSFIPESMRANEILNLLIKERRSLAVVLDEFGGTSGLVTVEDVVEELFGEIDDEHDTEELLEVKVNDHEYRFSARQEVDFLNEKYDLKLPESENYNTLGGLVIDHLESIPEKGEVVKTEDFVFKVEEVSNSKIEVVRVKVID